MKKWLRIWIEETLKGTTFDELGLAERGVWFSLLVLAGNSLSEGIVELRKGVGYTLPHLANTINCKPEELNGAISRLIEVGKIQLLGNRGLKARKKIKEWCLGPQSDSQSDPQFDSQFASQQYRVKIVHWERYQTRYDKYYKGNDDKGKKKLAHICQTEEEGEVEREEEVEEDNKKNGSISFSTFKDTQIAMISTLRSPKKVNQRLVDLGLDRGAIDYIMSLGPYNAGKVVNRLIDELEKREMDVVQCRNFLIAKLKEE